jgi:chromatin segregation and condensation protein Rec8/ScpA/Scc1 (kleisin family)
MSLSLIALVLGVAVLVSHLFALARPAATTAWLRGFPRNVPVGVVLMLIGTAWFEWNLNNENLDDIAKFKPAMQAAFAILGVASCFFVKDFLSVRGLCVVMLMAAWLAYLKSKLLLPSEKKAGEEPGGEEMAQRLAFRLARLDGMRKAVDQLNAGHIDGRDVFRRGLPEFSKIVHQIQWQASLHDLLTAFADINLRKIKRRAHVVKRQPVLGLDLARKRLGQMIPQLTEWTAVQSMRAQPEDAPDAPRKSETASFFSAALELTKEDRVELRQDRAFADVLVRKKGAGLQPPEGAS